MVYIRCSDLTHLIAGSWYIWPTSSYLPGNPVLSNHVCILSLFLSLLLSFSSPFSSLRHAHDMQKFLGQGLNARHGSDTQFLIAKPPGNSSTLFLSVTLFPHASDTMWHLSLFWLISLSIVASSSIQVVDGKISFLLAAE